jgi:hypothetical protein
MVQLTRAYIKLQKYRYPWMGLLVHISTSRIVTHSPGPGTDPRVGANQPEPPLICKRSLKVTMKHWITWVFQSCIRPYGQRGWLSVLLKGTWKLFWFWWDMKPHFLVISVPHHPSCSFIDIQDYPIPDYSHWPHHWLFSQTAIWWHQYLSNTMYQPQAPINPVECQLGYYWLIDNIGRLM